VEKNNGSMIDSIKRYALIFITLCISLLFFTKDSIADKSPVFIRDAEIEYYLHELGKPIFHAASLDPSGINILIIRNNNINAFVAGGMNIFIYTGLLQKTESPEELQAVIAHETGHIAGGHLLRGQEAMENASAQAIIGMIVGVIAGIASGNGNVAIGTIGGAQTIAGRLFLRFSRSQEASADAAAMRFLKETGQNANGLLSFIKKLKGQEYLPESKQSEYVRTHPLSSDRINAIKYFIKRNKNKITKLNKSFQIKHKRMKAKLLGYLHPQTALLRYTNKAKEINERYARTIALERTNKTKEALLLIDTLLKDEPNNPFFLELKAQIFFETGQILKSVIFYKKAVSILPDSALLRLAYGHALLENDNINQSIIELKEAGRLEERSPQTWHLLAIAYGRKSRINKSRKYQGLSLYSLAEEAISLRKYKDAKKYANRSIKLLKKGSPYWLRAQDIKLIAINNSKDWLSLKKLFFCASWVIFI